MRLGDLMMEAAELLVLLVVPALSGALAGSLLAGLAEAKTQIRATTLSLTLRLTLGGGALLLAVPFLLPRLQHLALSALAFAAKPAP